MQNSDNIDNIIDRVLFSQDDIEEICQRLGKQLTEDYAGKFPLVIGVCRLFHDGFNSSHECKDAK